MKLVIVDLDGTLIDTNNVNFCAYKEALNSFGYNLDYEYFTNYCNGSHYIKFLSEILKTDISVIEQIHDLKKECYRKYLDKAKLNYHLLEILETMKSKYRIALVTTANKINTFEILERFGLKSFFDMVFTQEDVANKKPDPEGFLLAMNKFSASPEDTIIFEDSKEGIIAAHKCGAALFVVDNF